MIEKKYLEKLNKINLFSHLGEDALEKILNSFNSKLIQLDKNQIIFNEGEYYQNMCILLEGEVILSKTDEYGNRNIIDSVGENQIFAEVFSFTSRKISPVTATTNKKSTLLLINTEQLLSIENIGDLDLIKDKQEIISKLLHTFADKNLILLSKIDIVSRRNIREKILHFLELNKVKKGKNIFIIPYSRKDMADFLGVDRSALSRELSRLKDDGLIDYEKNTFKLL
ncbi:cyclic nucleotide-binding protein [Peptostreptococcus sp. MV1]|uniref:Crp/Fnr family transcriptional regulator n=1 Tax=Peptostreptococcus sp. MV1 TaxID=1219626 RepID=UPI00050F0A90|nr:Crp/Fnr family transcriptional regulator [Peptostreptococcus sp. MV1]KGF12238.1 cyclic nucleotide-binding protein [Peptostreptococcus sp. MV1]